MAPCDGDGFGVDSEVIAFGRIAGERLRQDPADADALFVLAASRLACGHLSEAARFLRDLTQVRNDYPGLWQLRTTVHEALGEVQAADACARAARRQLDA